MSFLQEERKYGRSFTLAHSLLGLGERNLMHNCCVFFSIKFFLIHSVVRKQGDSDRAGQAAYCKGKHPASPPWTSCSSVGKRGCRNCLVGGGRGHRRGVLDRRVRQTQCQHQAMLCDAKRRLRSSSGESSYVKLCALLYSGLLWQIVMGSDVGHYVHHSITSVKTHCGEQKVSFCLLFNDLEGLCASQVINLSIIFNC